MKADRSEIVRVYDDLAVLTRFDAASGEATPLVGFAAATARRTLIRGW
jgi:hypothetical protein